LTPLSQKLKIKTRTLNDNPLDMPHNALSERRLISAAFHIIECGGVEPGRIMKVSTQLWLALVLVAWHRPESQAADPNHNKSRGILEEADSCFEIPTIR